MSSSTGIARVNGTELHYEIAGHGPIVVLLHGFSLDSRMWDDQFAPLSEYFTVVRYDLRGFGRSIVAIDQAYSPSDDLRALLDYLSIDNIAIVGLSMGGGFAIDFALDAPNMVNALIAADSTLSGHEWTLGEPATWHNAIAANEGIDAAKTAWLNCDLFANARQHPGVRSRLARYVADYSGWHWLNENPIKLAQPPASERLKDISCPTLALVGEYDNDDFRAVQAAMASEIGDINTIEFADCGHMSNMENPKAFNKAVLEFLL